MFFRQWQSVNLCKTEKNLGVQWTKKYGDLNSLSLLSWNQVAYLHILFAIYHYY